MRVDWTSSFWLHTIMPLVVWVITEKRDASVLLLAEHAEYSPLQYSCLENPMDRAAWWATVYGIALSQTGLSDQHFHFSQ